MAAVGARRQPAKMLRVGALSAQPREAPIWVAFDQRMIELGYKQGTNFALEFVQVVSIGDYERGYRELATRKVDIMLGTGPEIALKSGRAATQTLPVMLAIEYDPIARGYVTSLARPTGNITGIFLQQIELAEKRVQILKDAFPDFLQGRDRVLGPNVDRPMASGANRCGHPGVPTCRGPATRPAL